MVDVKKIRNKFGLSQYQFAEQFGFNLGTLRHWEQGNRSPDKAASILLRIVERSPEAVKDALRSYEPSLDY